jgi:hypothetical protein
MKKLKQKQFLPERKTKYELMIVLFQYWATKFGVPGIQIERDNRFNGHMITESWDDGHVMLRYNARRLGNWSYALVVSGVFHELAHIFMDMPYDTDKQQVASEYEAEVFSLQCVKCFYPQFTKEIVDYMKDRMYKPRFKRLYPMHFLAFSKINDYKL